MNTTAPSPIHEPRPDAVSVAGAGDVLNARMLIIGRHGRVFPMTEMTALDFAALIELVLSEASTWQTEGILSEGDLRINTTDLLALVPLLLKLLRRARAFFAKAIVLVFGMGENAETEDGRYITENITLKQLSEAILAFMETNAWEDVVANFLSVGQSAQKVAARFNRGPSTSSASSGISSAPASAPGPNGA